ESPEQLAGHNLAEVYADPADRDEIIRRYEEGGLVRGVEVAWKRRDGTAVWVELHFHSKKDEQIWSRNTEGFVLDITRRLRGVEAPRVKEQLGRSAHGYVWTP
ncbi:MAG TPA: PAS domain-containing protein, partial [Thermoanaerobaculia bacterium]|nr:PAS domain-containing protein [Thermoanaerobaculia bacterium]